MNSLRANYKKMDIKIVELQFQSAESYLLVFMIKMVILIFSWYLPGIFLIGPILQHKLHHVCDKFCHILDGFS